MNAKSIQQLYKKIKSLPTDVIINTLKLDKSIIKSQVVFKTHSKTNPTELKRIVKILIKQEQHGAGWFDTLAGNLGFDTHEQQGPMTIGRDKEGNRVYNKAMEDELKRVAKNEIASKKLLNETIPTLASSVVKKVAETLLTPEVGPEAAMFLSAGLGKATSTVLKGEGSVCSHCGSELHGEGLGLSQAEMPNSIKTLLAQHGDSPIVSMIAWRQPVMSRNIINLISLGQFEKNIKTLDYRDVFHVGVSYTLEDGYKGTLEKIESVVATPYKDNLSKSDYLTTKPRLSNTTLNDAFKNLVSRLGVDLWRYNARDANCQHFVMNFLSNGITNALTPQIETFIKQNAVALTKGTPNKLMTFIVDIERKIKQGIMN